MTSIESPSLRPRRGPRRPPQPELRSRSAAVHPRRRRRARAPSRAHVRPHRERGPRAHPRAQAPGRDAWRRLRPRRGRRPAGRGGDRPYNDLELYVAIRGNRHVNEFLYHRRLDVLGEILTHLADAEVELKVTSLAELAARPVSMFSYDLAAGHRLLWSRGPADRPPCSELHRDPENIPQAEATRLLMNRCTGLLLARAELEREPFTPGAADFVRRNVAKAQLACGDALLTAHGRYHWSCRERHRRLEELAQGQALAVVRRRAPAPRRRRGVQAPPRGRGCPRDQLAARHGEVTAFALEMLAVARGAAPRPHISLGARLCRGRMRQMPRLLPISQHPAQPAGRWLPTRGEAKAMEASAPANTPLAGAASMGAEASCRTGRAGAHSGQSSGSAAATPPIGVTAYRALWCQIR